MTKKEPTKVLRSKTNKQVVGGGYHRPVCPKCNCELHSHENGVGVVDMAKFGPYEIWNADLWKCPKCGIEVVGGFGKGPITRHFEDNFERIKSGYKHLITNNG